MLVRAFATVLLLIGCAEGGTLAETDTGPRMPIDTGVLMPRGDTGVPPPPPPPTCMDDSHPNDCAAAMDVGMLMPGSPPITVTGFLPELSDQDWFKIGFPPMSMPNTFGGGTINITLSGDATTIFDVHLDCMRIATCGMGENRELTSYSFTDDQSAGMGMDEVMTGAPPNDYSTRMVDWPASLIIRVAKRGGPATCDSYSLTFTR